MIQEAKRKGKAIMDDLRQQEWHLSKRVQVADIIGMILIAATLAAWVFGIEKQVESNGQRIDKHETVTAVEIRNLKEQDAQIRQEIDEHFEAILIQLRRIEDKLDRHTEGHNSPGMQLQEASDVTGEPKTYRATGNAGSAHSVRVDRGS